MQIPFLFVLVATFIYPFVTPTRRCCLVQVVERLLSLPADYWSQFVTAAAAASEPPNSDHLIIENSNCYATPERSERTRPRPRPSISLPVSLTEPSCVVSFQ